MSTSADRKRKRLEAEKKGRPLALYQAIVAAIAQYYPSASEEDITRLLEDKERLRQVAWLIERPTESDVLPASFDYGVGHTSAERFTAVCEAAHFDGVDPLLVPEAAILDGTGRLEFEFTLLKFPDREIPNGEVVGRIIGRGWQEARTEHALAVSLQYPRFQQHHRIVATQAIWNTAEGKQALILAGYAGHTSYAIGQGNACWVRERRFLSRRTAEPLTIVGHYTEDYRWSGDELFMGVRPKR